MPSGPVGYGFPMSSGWQVKRLYTGDIWYAPRSAFYLIAGCGGGGGGSGTSGVNGGGGGSGATLCLYPIYFADGNGGPVTIGLGGAGAPANTTPGSNGTDTSLGSALVLGGGYGGISLANDAPSGSISGAAFIASGSLLTSQGTVGSRSSLTGQGGDSFPLSSSLTSNIVDDFLYGRLRPSRGGIRDIPAQANGASFGAGGAGALSVVQPGGNGADGCLIIAWVGSL